MTIRLNDPDLENTDKLIQQLLSLTRGTDARVEFLVPPGQARKVIARIRVMISRRRTVMAKRGKKIRRFRLNTEVYPWSDLTGNRREAIVAWESYGETHLYSEILEDLLTNG